MLRTTAPGNQSGLYSEGNPSLSIPATTVSAQAMNDLQEELVGLILGSGQSLLATQNQVLLAVQALIANGGTATATSFAITNNQGTFANVTGLVFDKTVYKAARIYYDILRKTDSSNVNESGEIYVSYNTQTTTWLIAVVSNFDDAGMTWNIDSNGQVQYKSTNIAGTTYVGTMRFSHIRRLTL
jgi:hypothetical protein